MRHDFFGKTEKLLIGTALGVFVICLYCLFFDPTVFGLWQSHQKKSNKPVVGQITFLENDTRHQQLGTLSWQPAQNKQQVHLGDSIFTGARSRSQVTFAKDGGHVDLGENTLLVFGKVQNVEVPNFIEGNFRLQVKGEMKIAIAGEVTQIKGENSEVQIFMDKKVKKPQLKVLKGKAIVKQGTAPAVELKTNQVSALRVPASIPSSIKEPELEAVKIEELKTVQTLQPADETLFYTSQLYDFYEKKDNLLARKDQRPSYVNFQKKLSWVTQGDVQKIWGQLSSTPGFDKSVLPFESSEKEFTLNHAFLGENHWKLSIDNKNWTTASKFFVKSTLLPIEHLKVTFPQSTYAIFNQPININGIIEAPVGISNFVFEFSRSPDFPTTATRIHWLAKNQLSLKINTPGNYYLRVRGVNQKMEITDFSNVIEIKAARPEPPSMPRLAKENFSVYQGERVQLGWDTSSGSKDFEVLITDKNGNLVANKIVNEDKLSWKTTKTGTYKAQISSIDKWGQKSASVQATVQVKPKPLPEQNQLQPTLSQTASNKAPEVRKPSSLPTSESAMSLNVPDESIKNLSLSSSKLQLEGAVFSMHSQGQESKPAVLAFTGRILNWWDSNGFEGAVKSKAASLDNNANVPAPLQLEARYHHRWFLPFNLFSSGNTQVSLIGGYEFYRNPTVGYSPQYDLIKTGFSVDFPLMRNWDTGGEMLYGYGLDSSQKYEISGRLNYYIQRKWSMGVGYRMHFFEAGSDKSAPPMGVPYREAYGEGYSVLRWHY